MTGTAREIRANKARNLRYKKPMLREINLEAIQCWLTEAMEACSEWAWVDAEMRDEMLDAFDGNDEEYYAYQNAFAALDEDLNRFYEDLQEFDVPACFDDFLCGIGGDGGEMLGYDAAEGDYFGLDTTYEQTIAIEEANKRLMRMAKGEILDVAGRCFRVALSYMALRGRVEDLTAAVEIARGLNKDVLQSVRDIQALYDDMAEERDGGGFSRDKERAFDAALEKLPAESWLR